MIRQWVTGWDEIYVILNKHRVIQLEIARLADKLAECSIKETIGFSQTVVQSASAIPALQRLIEKTESIREEITAECHDAAPLMDQCIKFYNMLTDQRHRDIIRMFYIYAMPMDAVATKIRYCRRWCEELRDEAICLIARKVFASVRKET